MRTIRLLPAIMIALTLSLTACASVPNVVETTRTPAAENLPSPGSTDDAGLNLDTACELLNVQLTEASGQLDKASAAAADARWADLGPVIETLGGRIVEVNSLADRAENADFAKLATRLGGTLTDQRDLLADLQGDPNEATARDLLAGGQDLVALSSQIMQVCAG